MLHVSDIMQIACPCILHPSIKIEDPWHTRDQRTNSFPRGELAHWVPVWDGTIGHIYFIIQFKHVQANTSYFTLDTWNNCVSVSIVIWYVRSISASALDLFLSPAVNT